MRKTKYNAYFANCPTRRVLDRLADKWTVLVVGLLEQRPHRFSELLRGIDGISQKMLTQTLRSLELDGWLTAGSRRPSRSRSSTRSQRLDGR